MRLIDADALKKKLSSKDYITYTHEYGDAIPIEWLMSAIDNAPTVSQINIFCENADEKTIADMKEELLKVINDLIHKSEWNYIQAGMCVCPFCGAMPHKLYKNFCPNCGVNMKGGAE